MVTAMNKIERILAEADELFDGISNLKCPDCGRVDIEGGFTWHDPATERCISCHLKHLEAANRRLTGWLKFLPGKIQVSSDQDGYINKTLKAADEYLSGLIQLALAGEEPPK